MPPTCENRRRGVIIVHVEEEVVGKGGGPIHATEDEVQAEIQRVDDLSVSGIEVTVEKRSVMLGGPAADVLERMRLRDTVAMPRGR